MIEAVVEAAKARGVKVCVDLASYNIVAADRDFFARLLRKTDIVFANEDEARAFTGLEPEAALEQLASVCETAVVKVGKRGAYARRGEEVAFVPAKRAARRWSTPRPPATISPLASSMARRKTVRSSNVLPTARCWPTKSSRWLALNCQKQPGTESRKKFMRVAIDPPARYKTNILATRDTTHI